MARGKMTVESIDEQIRKLQERKAQMLNGAPSKAEQRAAFIKAVTHEFPDLDFAQLAGILASAYARMPIPAEQLDQLSAKGIEILKRHLPKKHGEAGASDSSPVPAPTVPSSTAPSAMVPPSGPVPISPTSSGFGPNGPGEE